MGVFICYSNDMYQPSFDFDRTPEEKRDMFKFWARDDRPFFAAGACHIMERRHLPWERAYKYIASFPDKPPLK